MKSNYLLLSYRERRLHARSHGSCKERQIFLNKSTVIPWANQRNLYWEWGQCNTQLLKKLSITALYFTYFFPLWQWLLLLMESSMLPQSTYLKINKTQKTLEHISDQGLKELWNETTEGLFYSNILCAKEHSWRGSKGQWGIFPGPLCLWLAGCGEPGRRPLSKMLSYYSAFWKDICEDWLLVNLSNPFSTIRPVYCPQE